MDADAERRTAFITRRRPIQRIGQLQLPRERRRGRVLERRDRDVRGRCGQRPAGGGRTIPTATERGPTLARLLPACSANDTDVDGDYLTAIVVSGPSHGALTLNANGSFIYTPAANYNGTDSFTLKDQQRQVRRSNVATVAIAVNSVKRCARGGRRQVATDEDVTLDVAAPRRPRQRHRRDAEPLDCGAGERSEPWHAGLNGDGSLSYTARGGLQRSRQLHLRASDGNGESTVATVSDRDQAPSPDAPSARRQQLQQNRRRCVDHRCARRARERPGRGRGDPLTAVLVSSPSRGTLTLNADGSFIYSSAAGYNGSDSFTYRARDGGGPSNVATVSIAVDAVNDGRRPSRTATAQTRTRRSSCRGARRPRQ